MPSREEEVRGTLGRAGFSAVCELYVSGWSKVEGHVA